MNAYIYKITYIPTGVMYFGSRKTPEALTPETDSYMGSPTKGSNLMAELLATKPAADFSKEILTVVPYETVGELENLVITEAWEKCGKVSQGGLVTNLAAWGVSIEASQETRAKQSAANIGKPRSSATKAKQSAAMSGKMIGSKNPKAKTVILVSTGEVYATTIKEAAEKAGVSWRTMMNYIYGYKLKSGVRKPGGIAYAVKS